MINGFKKTSKLPLDIRAVSKEDNTYDEMQIKKAGYVEIERIGNKKIGYMTTWKKSMSENFLIFMQKEKNGFYNFGGYGIKK